LKSDAADWEARCLERARGGDAAALVELYRAFAPRLYREVLLPCLGHAAAAEDALSETFRALLERLDGFEPKDGGLWAWLATVARNKANDQHRKRARTGRAVVSLERLLVPATPSDPHSLIENRVERTELAEAVKAALERINPRYKRAIELRFFEDRAREDCAELLAVTPSTFDVLLCRALKSFRKEWTERARSREEVET
jgi:RNA polymerase sigma-70 factor (ECF subfamily)